MESRVLIWSTRGLAAITGLALASTGECQPVFLFVFLSFYLMGIWIERYPAVVRLIGKAQPFLAAGMFGVAIIDFLYLSNSFLLTVAHFLLSLQGLRHLALRTQRENLGSALLSSMMMLSASTLAVGWGYFVFLIAFVPALIWTLMVHNISVEAVTAAAWPSLLPVLRRSATLAFSVSIACCLVVFLVFPRFNFRGFRGQFLQPVRKTGFSSQVDLRSSGRIFLDETVAMRVEMDPDQARHWPGYLRGSVLEYFDGSVWKRTPGRFQRIYRTSNKEMTLMPAARMKGDRIRQSIYLESMESGLLFAAPWAVTYRIDRPFIDVDEAGAAQRTNDDGWRIHYEVESVIGGLRMAWPGPRGTVPEDEAGVDDAIGHLAAKIVGKEKGSYATADRIEAYLRKNYTYSLNVVARPAGIAPVEHFLFETKQGHCEYFASAMCLMLRRLGIPSRVVTGFLAHEWNSRGKYYVVRMKDAHAWVEAYLPVRQAGLPPGGWVQFDPTPRDAGGSMVSPLKQRLDETVDYLNLVWNRWILSYDMEQQISIIKGVSAGSHGFSLFAQRWSDRFARLFSKLSLPQMRAMGERPDGMGPWVRALAAPFAVLLALAAALYAFFGRSRASRSLWFYRRLLRYLEKKTRPKKPGETLREYVHKATPVLGRNQGDVEFLTHEYYRLRFGPRRLLTPLDVLPIRRALRRLK